MYLYRLVFFANESLITDVDLWTSLDSSIYVRVPTDKSYNRILIRPYKIISPNRSALKYIIFGVVGFETFILI